MTKSTFGFFALAAVLSGCAERGGGPEGRAEPLTGGVEDDGVLASSLVHVSGTRCTGTMIAPDWLLTAAHCVIGYTPPPDTETTRIAWGWTAEGSAADRASFLRPNACYAHPYSGAILPGPGEPPPLRIERCTHILSDRTVPDSVDLALVHLAVPRDDLPFRAIGPFRGPVRTSLPTRFPALVRGWSGPAAVTGPLATAAANITNPDTLGLRRIEVFLSPGSLAGGDSGGPLTYAPSDDVGPVLGVAASTDPRDSSQGVYASVADPFNLDWIWTTLDPGGACTLGSTTPCVFRERRAPGETTDVCDDSHCTGVETPASCPADCTVVWPDSDGDGLPDIRDACPLLDARGVPAARLNPAGTNHLDTDDDGMGDDCELRTPVDCAATPGFDDDLDGIQNECDNCPDVVNVEQADCDGNGVGDECDVDTDGDRVPDGCDNCPEDDNTTQSNCNLDAEVLLGMPPVGDACDPNPCPDGATGVTPVPMGTLGGATTAAFSGVGRQTDRAGDYSAPTAIRTAFRWCACAAATGDSPPVRTRCRGLGSAGCEIDFRRIDDAFVSGDWGWRFPTVTFPTTSAYGNCFSTAPGPAAPECTALYNTLAPRPVPRTIGDIVNLRGARPLNFLAYWDFAADAATAGALFTHPDGMPYTQGVQWYRARGYETDAALVARLPAESCNRRGDCPAETEFTFDSDLTSHYSSGRVDAVPTRPYLRPLGPLGVFFFASRTSCATCAGAFPRVALTTVLCEGADCPLPRLFARLDARTDAEVSARFSPGALTLLRDPTLRFVAPAEPADRRAEHGLVLVAVDGSTLAPRAAFSDASGVVGLFQGQGDPLGPPSAQRSGAQPRGCTGAFPLLDGSRGTLFVLGGRCDGRARTAIGVTRFFSGGASELGLSGPLLEEVLAATLDPVSRDAIVLDRVTRRGRDEVRLLRVDLASGRSMLIATRRTTREFEHYHLAAALDGTVVLAASRRGRGYRLVHLRVPPVSGTVEVLQTHVVRAASLEGSIVTDAMGVSVLEAGAPWRPVGIRWMDFGERPGRARDLDDCF